MGEGGAKRIVLVLAIAAVVAIGVFWYWQHAKQRALGSGNVYVKNQGADQSQPASNPSPSTTAAPSQPEAHAAQASSAASPAASSTKPSAAIEKMPSAPQPPAHAAVPAMTQPRGAVEVPASDTIPRNPPNGLIFAGLGKYQLYRQGDITWRLDTNTGRSCIIFATDTLWAKVRVWDSGCGAS
jgi:cytoskeletal protein RodZ